MKYSLIEGLAAIGSFGIIMIANNNLYSYIKRFLLPRNKEIYIDQALVYLVPSCGLAYLAGILAHIIANSHVIITKDLLLLIVLGLSLPFLVTYFRLFRDISLSLCSKKPNSYFQGIVCAVWSYLFVKFIISPSMKYGISMLVFVLSLPFIYKALFSKK